MRACATCKEKKSVSNFSWRNKSKGLLQSHCKVCIKEKNKVQYENNKEKRVAYQTEWKKENPDKVSRYNRTYRENNLDRVKAWVKDWDTRNKGRRTAITNRYRAAKLNATPSWLTDEHKKSILTVYVKASEKGYHVDHIVPLQGKNVCGLHVPWNLQIMSPSNNCRKGNRFD